MDHRLDLLTLYIDGLMGRKKPMLIAIDGSCASGKSTLAAALSQVYDCNVFHMDDFFLRPEQRTDQRLREPGGNVDYERFRDEVLTPLKKGIHFSYRPFDCKTGSLLQPVAVEPKQLNIVEGSYCRHPYFGDPWTLRLFLTVPPEIRRQRILEHPAHLHSRFFDQWIPMEQEYFRTFQISETSDLIL